MKKYFIFDVLEIKDINIPMFITLAGLFDSELTELVDVDQYEALIEKGFLVLTEDHIPLITEKGSDYVRRYLRKEITINKKKTKKIEVSNDFITQYRNLFKGLKPGSMGYAKGVSQKMSRFFTENPETTEEEVINATRKYLDSLNNYQYLQQADYFIYKKDANGESSRLSAYIDEIRLNTTSDENWTTNLK